MRKSFTFTQRSMIPTILPTCCFVLMLYSTIASAKIVFTLRDDGRDRDINGVYVMDDNGMDITLLNDTVGSRNASWSPDGKQIMFSKYTNETAGRYIFLINPDGNNMRQITGLHEESTDINPFFFQRGKSIHFVRSNEGVRVVNVMDLESGEIRKIGDLDFLPVNPDLSPNGKYIVYTEHVVSISRGVSNIWMMNADGSNRTQLLPPVTRVPGMVFNQLIIDRRHPRWNQHGDQIVYTERRYKFVEFEPAILAIYQGIHYLIYDFKSGQVRELEGIPKELDADSIDWMDNDESLVFSACKRALFERDENIFPHYRFYKYHIPTGEISVLADHPGEPHSVDWISDDPHDHVYAVSRVGKLTTLWGELKRK